MVIEWYFFKKFEKQIDKSVWISKEPPVDRVDDLAITWIGHSTFLIQIQGINILTDPVFANLSLLFPRVLPPGINLENLPPIDFVIISHNHRDHMDNRALVYLKNNHKAKYLVPIGDKAWFDKKGFDNVFEFMWWEEFKFANSLFNDFIEFIFLPAAHWSQRGLFDYNKSLWGSWMIRTKNKLIYFAGDTSYSSHFSKISGEFENIDLAIMPIGPCEPRQWMKYSHINAEEAGQGFLDLRAKQFIPMHWGTYFFGIDSLDLPIQRLSAWWNSQNFEKDQILHLPKIGQRKNIIISQDDPFIRESDLPIRDIAL